MVNTCYVTQLSHTPPCACKHNFRIRQALQHTARLRPDGGHPLQQAVRHEHQPHKHPKRRKKLQATMMTHRTSPVHELPCHDTSLTGTGLTSITGVLGECWCAAGWGVSKPFKPVPCPRRCPAPRSYAPAPAARSCASFPPQTCAWAAGIVNPDNLISLTDTDESVPSPGG